MKQIIALAYKAETGDFSANELATAAWHYGRSKPVLKSLDGNVSVPVVASYIWPTDPIAIDYADGTSTVISKGDWVIDVQLDDAAEVLYNHGLISGLKKEWSEELHPRDEHGRFGDGNPGLDIPNLAHEAGEGFSIDPHTGRSPTTGFMVARSMYGAVIDTKNEEDTAKALRDYADKHAHLFDEDKSLYLGGWRNSENGKLYLDVVDNVANESDAVALGRNRDQISVFNIETFTEIPTGGTGEGNGKPEFDRHPDEILGEGTVVRKSARELHPAFGRREGRVGDGSGEEDSEQLAKEWDESNVERDEHGRFATKDGGDSSDNKKSEDRGVSYQDPANRRPGMGDIEITDKMMGGYLDDGKPFVDGGSFGARYDVTTGTWDPEIQAMHDKYVEDKLAGIEPNGGQPQFFMMGGGPASGKSTILDAKDSPISVPGKTEAVHLNPDDIKDDILGVEEMKNAANGDSVIPGVPNDQWAGWSHAESSYLAMRVQTAAAERGLDIVSDIVGDSGFAKLEAKLAPIKEAGYLMTANYVTCDTQTAVDRSIARAERTGRDVRVDVVESNHAGVSAVFPQAVSLFDNVTLSDTNGKPPVLIGSKSDGGAFTVTEPELYQKFLEKANT